MARFSFLVCCLCSAFTFPLFSQTYETRVAQVDSLIGKRQFKNAVPMIAALLDSAEQRYGTEAYLFQKILFKRGYCYFKTGQFEKAVPDLERCRVVLDKTSGADTEEYANLLFHLAASKRTADDFRGAVPVYEDLLGIYRRQHLDTTELYFRARLGYWQSQYAIGAMEQAEDFIVQDMQRMKTLNIADNRTYTGFALNLGNVYLDRGRYTRAQAAYEQCREVTTRLGLTDSLSCIGSLGLVLESRSKYIEAADVYDSVLKTLRENNLQERYSDYYSITLENLSGACYALGLSDKAKALMEEKLQFLEQQLGKDSDLYGLAQKSYGLILFGEGQAEAALPLLQRGAEISSRLYGSHNDNVTKDYLLLARCYLKFNRREEAESILRAQLDSINSAPQLDNYYKPGVVYTLAEVALLKGDLAGATAYLEESLALRKAHDDKGYDYAAACLRLAAIGELRGDLASAMHYLDEALGIYSRILHEGAAVFTERESIDFYQKFKLGSDKALSFAQRHPDIYPTGVLLQNELNNRSILTRSAESLQSWFSRTSDPEALALYDQWIDSREKLNHAYTQKTVDTTLVSSLEETEERSKRALAKKSGRFARSTGIEVEDWNAVRQRLKPGQAAVAISRFSRTGIGLDEVPQPAYVAFILKSGLETPQLVFLNDGTDMESIVSGMYAMDMRKESAGLHYSATYEAFWLPIEAHLKDISEVFLIPDGIYHKINPGTLQRPSGAWLQTVYDFHVINSLSEINTGAANIAATGDKTALLLGNPTFAPSANGENDVALRSANRFRLDPLPASEKEVQNIAALLLANQWKVDVALGKEATKERVRAVKSPAVLHLATHGYFLESAAKGVKLFGWEEKYVGQNPMLSSLLFFAGADGSGQNGILTAAEAQNLDLSSTELAVLSACNTGSGKIINGEGVYGLQLAFKLAGAKTLIMSLWPVDDRVTESLMTAFYRNWLNGQSKHEAFRQAQATVREHFPHPGDWGAFVMVGE